MRKSDCPHRGLRFSRKSRISKEFEVLRLVHAGKTKGEIEPLRLQRGRGKNRVDHLVCATSLKISRSERNARRFVLIWRISLAPKSRAGAIRSAAPPSHSSSHPHGTRQEEQEDDRRRYPHRSQEARLRRVRRRCRRLLHKAVLFNACSTAWGLVAPSLSWRRRAVLAPTVPRLLR